MLKELEDGSVYTIKLKDRKINVIKEDEKFYLNEGEAKWVRTNVKHMDRFEDEAKNILKYNKGAEIVINERYIETIVKWK